MTKFSNGEELVDIGDEAVYDALDQLSLEEHDRLYHHGHYREGQDCLVRERMAIGDNSDAALQDAENTEERMYAAKEAEKGVISRVFSEKYPFLSPRRAKKNGCDLRITDQRKNGDRWVLIFAPHDFDEKQVTESDLYGNCAKMGYRLKGMKVGFTQGNAAGNAKKLIAILMNNPHLVGTMATQGRDRSAIHVTEERSEPLSDARKAELLKRYGLTVGTGGKVVPRGREENESAVRKYLRIVESGGTALKNKSNAEIAKERADTAKAISANAHEYLKELGIRR